MWALLVTLAAGPTPARSAEAVLKRLVDVAYRVGVQGKLPARRVGVGPGCDPKRAVCLTVIDAPSLFDQQGCAPQPARATVCEVRGGGITCSADALAALVAHDPNHRANRPALPLMAVLAHELGHLAKGHRGGQAAAAGRLGGSASTRLKIIRNTVKQAQSTHAQEAEADAFAVALLKVAVTPEHRDALFGRVGLDSLRLTFLKSDAQAACGWSDDLPVYSARHLDSDEAKADVAFHAQRYVCRALAAPDGTPLPVVQGSHPDWSGRVRAYHALFPRRVPGLDGPLRPTAVLSGAVGDIQRVLETNREAMLARLVDAVVEATLSTSAARCAALQAPPPCLPLRGTLGPSESAPVAWTARQAPPDQALVLPGKVQGVAWAGATITAVTADPNHLHRWQLHQGLASHAPAPCEALWFSPSGLLGCVGALGRVSDGQARVRRVLHAYRDRTDRNPALEGRVGWIGELGGQAVASVQEGLGRAALVRWRGPRLREVPAGSVDGCQGLNQQGQLQVWAGNDAWWVGPVGGDDHVYRLPRSGRGPATRVDGSGWQEWAALNELSLGIPTRCRPSARGGARCITDEFVAFDPQAPPTPQTDGQLGVPPDKAQVSDVDFCDTREGRWIVGLGARSVWGVHIGPQGRGDDELSITGVEGGMPRLWCQPDGAVLTVPKGPQTVLVPLR